MIYYVSPLGPSGVWSSDLRIKSPELFQSATKTVVLKCQFILLASVHITFPKLTHETRFSCTSAHHKSSYDTFLMNTPFVNKSSWVIHWFSSWFIILSWMIVNCSLARSAVSCKTTYERPRVQQRHTSLTSFWQVWQQAEHSISRRNGVLQFWRHGKKCVSRSGSLNQTIGRVGTSCLFIALTI